MRKIDTAGVELLMAHFQKNSGLDKPAFNKVRKSLDKFAAKARGQKQKAKLRDEGLAKADEVDPSVTLEMHLFERCFGSNSGSQGAIVISETFYKYKKDHGYWHVIDDRTALKLLTKSSSRAWRWCGSRDAKFPKYQGSSAAAKAALSYSRMTLTLTGSELPENRHLRAFRNCTVDMRTGQPAPHSPDNYLTSAISSDYRPNAECPEVFMKFMCSNFGEDMIPIIRAAISMILDPTAPWGKFIHVIGPSGSGKGVLLRLFQEIFGKESSKGGSSFADFSDPEKRHQNLQGCSLYVIGDISGILRGIEAFLDLVDNAPMSARALFSSVTYNQTWNVRVAIGSVEYLPLENTAAGWDRRVYPILSKARPESSNIENLETKLSEAKGEIISWALGMPRTERDEIVRYPERFSDRVALSKYEASIYGDSVKSFVDSCLRPIPFMSRAVEPEVHPGILHDWYVAYCRAHGLLPKGQPKFINHLQNVIPNHYQRRRRLTATETTQRDSNGKPPMIAPKWSWLEALPNIFEIERDQYGATGTLEKGFKCLKHSCKEGQLSEFQEWNPMPTTANLVPNSDRSDRSGSEYGKSVEPIEINGDRGDRGDRGISLNSDNLEKLLLNEDEIIDV